MENTALGALTFSLHAKRRHSTTEARRFPLGNADPVAELSVTMPQNALFVRSTTSCDEP
jgi:hypothetical protein